jgi:hypothetical protein
LIFQADENNIWKKYLGIRGKCEILHVGRFEYLPQLLYWDIDQRLTIFKEKLDFRVRLEFDRNSNWIL